MESADGGGLNKMCSGGINNYQDLNSQYFLDNVGILDKYSQQW